MNNGVNNQNIQNKAVPSTAAPVIPSQQVSAQNQQSQQLGYQQVQQQTINNSQQTPSQTQVTIPQTQPVNNNQPVITQQQSPQAPPPPKKEKTKKKKNYLARFFFFIIVILGAYVFYLINVHQLEIAKLNEACTPVSTTKETKELDLDSTIVQDLYSKVSTNIREDIISTTLDDKMKLYLAYRQIPSKKMYESNCNLFSNTSMEPYTCIESLTFVPKAFKEETLQVELKKLFGEQTNIANANIQLGSSCIGGYQYIVQRGEYVEGYCQNESYTQYKATKKLVKATSKQSIITLTEEVQYKGTETEAPPEHLKSGTYIYTFKLDTNYNYVYISKELEQ